MDQLDTGRTVRRIAVAACAIIVTLGLTPQRVTAHAFPAGSVPKVGSTVPSAPPAVTITFDNSVEPMFAKLDVLEHDGRSVTVGNPALSADHRQLSIKLKPLIAGTYTVKWSVVAEDTHRTEGAFDFTVRP